VWLTAPLVWEVHEEPSDDLRYTSHELQALLERAGFVAIETQPLGGYFATLAQLLRSCGPITGLSTRRPLGRALSGALWHVAPVIRRLDRLDDRRVPLGYARRARRAPDSISAKVASNHTR
jgi:hypothetical protein